jgi:hypothetical protein
MLILVTVPPPPSPPAVGAAGLGELLQPHAAAVMSAAPTAPTSNLVRISVLLLCLRIAWLVSLHDSTA